ncbi:MAG TPA: radical SAM family heme chaperone HemW [Stellaceae bacterium]|nr:radical SAM family heme chaperone HemW [Stellaceae bacterium]
MSDAPLALYIHWPFCASKCPYCDFNSHVRDQVEQDRWRRALLAELDHAAAESSGGPLHSIFFGGGTPSLMSPETVAALIARAARHWRFGDDIEITLEANPNSVEAGRFRALREAGVNRLSLGVQAFDDAALRFLGRRHDRAEALAAIETARRHFARFSFDLIYARPDQGVVAWMGELERAIALAGEHLSLYQLTVEPGTAFATAAARGEWQVPDDELAGALYEATAERLAPAGFAAYEISNYARPGGECRHNLTYWRYGDYIGIGPGAHGRITRAGTKHATRRWRLPERWLEAVERRGHGLEEALPLTAAEQAREALMMGLRLAEGIDAARFRAATGTDLDAAIECKAVARLVEGGFLVAHDRGLRATAAGRQRLNSVLGEILL